MSTLIDMDDPLAAAPPRDTPPVSSGETGSPDQGKAFPGESKARRGRKPGDAQLKADLKEIEEKLTQLLQMPSIPMDAAGDDWPARHIEQRSPALAHAITETARNNVQLREKLLQFLRIGDGAGLAFAALAYAAPVALYYGVIPIPSPMRAQLPVPTREGARKPSIIDRMREEEEWIASTRRARSTEDPHEPQGNGSNAAQAQARTPPAI